MKAARQRLVRALQSELRDNSIQRDSTRRIELEHEGWEIKQEQNTTTFKRGWVDISTRTSQAAEFPVGLVEPGEMQVRRFDIKIQPSGKEKTMIIKVVVPTASSLKKVPTETTVVQDVLIIPNSELNNKQYQPFIEWKHKFSEQLILSEMQRLGVNDNFLFQAEAVAADHEEGGYRDWLSGCMNVIDNGKKSTSTI